MAEEQHDWRIRAVTLNSQGQSCIRVFTVAMPAGSGKNGIGALSEVLPVDGMMLRETPADYDYKWHCAPRRQFIVNLDAAVEIQVEAGPAARFEPGELFFVEDVTGRGHQSRAVEARPRRSIFLPVKPTFAPRFESEDQEST